MGTTKRIELMKSVIRYDFLGVYMIRVYLLLGLSLFSSLLLGSEGRGGGARASAYLVDNSLEGTLEPSPRGRFTQVDINRPESELVVALEVGDGEYLETYQKKHEIELRNGVDRSFPYLVLFPFRAEHGDPVGHLLATPDISDAVKRRAFRLFTNKLGYPATKEQQAEFVRLGGTIVSLPN